MSTAIKHLVPEWVKPSFVIFNTEHSGAQSRRQSAQMSKITNDGLTQSGTRCFIAVGLPIMATVGVKRLR